jgi:hypothetical protein
VSRLRAREIIGSLLFVAFLLAATIVFWWMGDDSAVYLAGVTVFLGLGEVLVLRQKAKARSRRVRRDEDPPAGPSGR